MHNVSEPAATPAKGFSLDERLERGAIEYFPVCPFPLLATVLCVYLAGRIFRVGILMQGKGAELSQLVKWVFRG